MSRPYTQCSKNGKKVPSDVKKEARLGLELKGVKNFSSISRGDNLDKLNGFAGGTQTGWDRAIQLMNCEYISKDALTFMKNWFARHGPDAKNGGTSYPGYQKWVKDGKPKDGKPKDGNKNKYRGAVSWLIWGGDPAYQWIKKLEKEGYFSSSNSTKNENWKSNEKMVEICTIL